MSHIPHHTDSTTAPMQKQLSQGFALGATATHTSSILCRKWAIHSSFRARTVPPITTRSGMTLCAFPASTCSSSAAASSTHAYMRNCSC